MHTRGNYRYQVCERGGEGLPGGVEIEVFWQIILGLYLGKKSKEVMFFLYF
jgi:hypothetical protein